MCVFIMSCLSFFFNVIYSHLLLFFFFFNDTATTEIYTLSLHDALPISSGRRMEARWEIEEVDGHRASEARDRNDAHGKLYGDRKSTRLNSSHGYISYAVFCLKKKKKIKKTR